VATDGPLGSFWARLDGVRNVYDLSGRAGRARSLTLVMLAGGCVILVPWVGYLAGSLPDRFDTGQWRLAWVGFDVGLLCLWGIAGWLGWRRHPATVAVLAAIAALMCCDAWFDVMLDWRAADWTDSVALAVAVELPVAGLLLTRARHLLIGGTVTRRLTLTDLDLHTDATVQRILRAVREEGGADATTLAATTGLPRSEVETALHRLRNSGYLERSRGGRWRSRAIDLRRPKSTDFDAAGHERYAHYMQTKLDRELRVFARAAAHYDRLGPWGRGSRATAYLSEKDLAQFEAEYLDLINRYAHRHDTTSARVHAIALRFYAFPQSLIEEVDREAGAHV
jgi:DNA-binding transcriptional ArsR family regulator